VSIVKGFIFLVLLVVLVYFFAENNDKSIDIDFFGKTFLGISIYWIVLVSFMLGFATSFISATMREFRLRRDITRLRKDNTTKDREIADLRTLPLRQEADPAEETAGE